MSQRWGYRPMDWLLVRTPLLPAAPERPITDALQDPMADLAIWIGSEALWDSLHRPGGAPRRTLVKAGRYVHRMSHRPTPYGIFAGVALGAWGRLTDICLVRMPGVIRTRVDMAWLYALIEQLEAEPAIRRQLSFAVHPAVLVRGGRIYLADPPSPVDSPADSAATGAMTGWLSLRATRPVRAALRACRGWATHQELVAAICAASPLAGPGKAEGLIEDLRRCGVILSDLRPPLTVADPARHLADRLAAIGDPAGRGRRLRALIGDADRCDRLPPAESLAGRRRCSSLGRELVPGVVPALRTDAVAHLDGTRVHSAVGREAARAVELLLRTAPPRGPQSSLREYRLAFEERYGRHRPVPLLELINPHVGLGFPEPALPSAAPTGRDESLLGLAAQAIRAGEATVGLDDDTLARISRRVDAEQLPRSLEVVVEIAATSPGAIDSGLFKVVVAPIVGARSAGRMLGRFAFLLGDEAIHAVTQAPNPSGDTVEADVTYQPLRPRAANVAICPATHEYLVPVGVPAPDQPTIALADLTVTLESETLVVRWADTGQHVRLHSPHMLGPTVTPRIVTFLHQLGGDLAVREFDWGAADRLPFLPRVEHGRVVLSLARWRLRRTDLPTADHRSFRAALAAFGGLWHLPDMVYLAEYDNRVTLGLDRPDDVEHLRRSLHRRGTVVLQERYPDPADAWLPGPAGRHVAEIVIPLALQTATGRTLSQETRVAPPEQVTPQRRLAGPGSDWVYAKLYAPTVQHDDLIAGPVQRLAADLSAVGLVTGWHFLRYADPQHHLRVRFQLGAADDWPKVAGIVSDAWRPLIGDGVTHRLGFDTYEREVERFGGLRGMALAETVFAADSRAALALVRGIVHGSVVLDRLLLAVVSVDALLGDLGMSAAERETLARVMAGDRASSGMPFRAAKQTLRTLLAGDPDQTEVQEIFDARRCTITALLGENPKLPGWSLPDPGALASLAHLHCNRLLGTDRAQERLVYGLLARARHSLAQWPG